MSVTGIAQLDAWRRHILPGVEKLPHGLWSLPVPITGHPLRYTLCYLIETERGPVLIDPGWPDETAWENLVEGLATAGFTPSDVHGVLVTHAHSDHHGLAGRIRAISGCWIGMHPLDAALLRSFADGTAVRQRNGPFFDIAGVPEGHRDALRSDDEWLRSLAEAAPDRDINEHSARIVQGRALRALWTPGHTPGHLTFLDEDTMTIFTGDHLLPRITPNVGAYDLDGDDVLGNYQESLVAMRDLEDDVDVMPAHEYRFRGVAARVDALIHHHATRSAELVAAVSDLGSSASVWEVAALVSWSRGWELTTGPGRRLALAETLAHLRNLEVTGRLRRVAELPARWAAIDGCVPA